MLCPFAPPRAASPRTPPTASRHGACEAAAHCHRLIASAHRTAGLKGRRHRRARGARIVEGRARRRSWRGVVRRVAHRRRHRRAPPRPSPPRALPTAPFATARGRRPLCRCHRRASVPSSQRAAAPRSGPHHRAGAATPRCDPRRPAHLHSALVLTVAHCAGRCLPTDTVPTDTALTDAEPHRRAPHRRAPHRHTPHRRAPRRTERRTVLWGTVQTTAALAASARAVTLCMAVHDECGWVASPGV